MAKMDFRRLCIGNKYNLVIQRNSRRERIIVSPGVLCYIEDSYEKINEGMSEEMQDRKLEQALEIYFQDESDREAKEFQEAEKYLRLRIRPAMEFLIEKEDTERMEQIEKCGWFSIKELEGFIRCAREKNRLRSLVWLLHLKDRKYGYQKKDFSL